MKVITYEIQQQVRVRKYSTDCKKLCDLLRKHKKMASLSNKEIAETLNIPITKVEHWFRQDSCFSIPDAENWFELKSLLGIKTTEFDEQITVFVEKENVFEKGNRIYDSYGLCPTITCIGTEITILDRSNQMEVKVIGQMDNTIDHTFESANRVYDVGGISPTINTCGGGGLQPKILEDAQAIRMVRTEEGKALRKDYESGAIHHGFNEHREMELRTDGVSNTLSTVQKDNYICEKSIVAMRGRNPDNPSDRTAGSPTEQRLEPNSQGICNTLTSVQKDNLVMEKVVIDDTYANRQPRVYEDYSPALRSEREGLKTIEVKQLGFMDNGTGKHQSNTVYDENALCPNITTIEGGGTQQIKVMTETYSPYVNQKYEEFFEENGYIPEYFNPYNKTELADVAPTLTAQGESVTKSSTVLKCDTQYRIRKLTPRECWRLMDFTDEDFEKAAQVNSNTQLYKQAGNSIVKNVLVAILGQMIPGKEDVYKEIQK